MPSFITLFIAAGALVATPPTAAKEKPNKDQAAAKPAEPYKGFCKDRALLRKYLIHEGKDGGKETQASSAEACQAAKRIFSGVSFLFRTREEVLQILGDPATISDYNEAAGKDPLSPLCYVFDTGFGGLKYTFEFGRWDDPRVTVVRVEGLN